MTLATSTFIRESLAECLQAGKWIAVDKTDFMW